MSIYSVLIASAVSENCYLEEALYWMAVRRFPIFRPVSSSYWGDIREFDEGNHLFYPEFRPEPPSEAETRFAGLPAFPQLVGNFDSYDPPARVLERHLIEDLTAGLLKDKEEIEDRKTQIENSRENESVLHEWEQVFNARLKEEWIHLFDALREGRVQATGQPIENALLAQLVADEEVRSSRFDQEGLPLKYNLSDATSPSWEDGSREPIPEGFWNARNTKWKWSCATGNGGAYALILINTQSLIQAFPAPEPHDESVRKAAQIGDAFILMGKAENPPTPKKKRGRPPFPWIEFHVEMAKRVRDGKLPSKQESMISDMQAWARKKWGEAPERSTMLQNLKPYYDEFGR